MKIRTSEYEAATKDALIAREEEGKIRTGWLMHEQIGQVRPGLLQRRRVTTGDNLLNISKQTGEKFE